MNEVIEIVEPPLQPAPTPLAILSAAVAKGVDPVSLKQLMELQERYEANEARKEFVQAMAAFKAKPPKIGKNKEVDFTGNTGKRTHYKHATLDNVCDLIGAALAEHGLSFTWRTEQLEGGLIRVACILTHQRGHSQETALQAGRDESGNKNSIQAVGSTVTYLQRYTLLAATGMAVADGSDDDGRQGKKMSEQQKANLEAAIDSVADEAGAGKLWQEILAATTAAGDVEAHEILKSALLAKRKALKAGK